MADKKISALTLITAAGLDQANDRFTVYDASAAAAEKNKAMLPSEVALLASGGLTANTTVNFTSAQTAAQIQADIDAQPKNLNGFTLTFQFADGSYTLTEGLLFEDFYGGITYILGNSSNNSLSTTKAVTLTQTAGSISTITVNRCEYAEVSYLKVDNSSGFGAQTIEFRSVVGAVNYGYYLGGAAQIYGNRAIIQANDNYVSLGTNAIYSALSRIYSTNNVTTGTQATGYGLRATAAGTVGHNGTQPTGATAAEFSNNGGVIRS